MSSPRRLPLIGAFAAALVLTATALPAADLVEYYHKELDHYFITGYAPEIKALDSGVHPGWTRTGLTIPTLDSGTGAYATAVSVCRFYGNPLRGLDSHFYSASKAECEAVKQKWPDDWMLESEDVFRVQPVNPTTGACPANTKAVYRLWNKRSDINHRYTTDPAVFDSMIAKGYTAEGFGNPQKPIVFCASNAGPAQPVAGAPVCTVTSSAAFPVINTPVTLTATCTDSPATYAWINCTGTASTCTVDSAAVGALSYGVVATNTRGSSAPATISLNWQVAASGMPACTVAASNSAPLLGSGLTLTGNCSHAPTRYQWMSCSALLVQVCNPLSECTSGTASCSPVGTQVGPVFYALVASNSAGVSEKAGVGVDWRTGGTSAPPPPSSPTPTCSISPSSTSPAVGTSLVLTASCTNSPTAFQWSSCASTSNTCTTTETTPATRNYSVTGSNGAGVGFPASVSVFWQQPPTAPPSCGLSASSPTPYLGGTVTLTANCTQSPTSFNWTGCNGSGATCQASASALGNATYSVTATNGFGTSQPAPVTVDWQTPPPSGADFCGQYTNVVRVTLPWGGHLDTYQNGGFPAGAVVVGRFTVPQNATGFTSAGGISLVEYIDPQARRVVTFSPSACDFRGFTPGVFPAVDPTGATRPMAWGFGINPYVQFGLTGLPGSGVRLDPGRTYYVNIRNLDFATGTNSCQGTTCNVRLTIDTPR